MIFWIPYYCLLLPIVAAILAAVQLFVCWPIMGAAATAGVSDAINNATDAELKLAISQLPVAHRQKVALGQLEW